MDEIDNIDYIALIGHSYGAALAFRIAAQYFNKLNLIFLIDPVGAGRKYWLQNLFIELNLNIFPTIKNLRKNNCQVYIAFADSSNYKHWSNIVAIIGHRWLKNKKINKLIAKKLIGRQIFPHNAFAHNQFSAMMDYGEYDDLSLKHKLIAKIQHYFKSN